MHANMTCKHHMKIICVRMKKQNALKREILNPNQDWAFLGRKFSLAYAPAALLDADFGPLGRNQHPARRGTILFDCHPDVRLRVK